MFKKNEAHGQLEIFSASTQLNKNQQKLWDRSKEHFFYVNIFSKIQETQFACLFSTKKSRPNTPINQLVGALMLKHLYDWTYCELFTNLNFNILTRHAIGIQNIGDSVFCEASIFNFQNKLIKHLEQTGEDLIENVFCQLTMQQIKELGVDTSVQRGDSFLVGSNIMDYTRLGLLIEVLKRLSLKLSDSDSNKLKGCLKPYRINTSTNYIYHVEKKNLSSEFQRISQAYYEVFITIENRYEEYPEHKIFLRVFNEHFIVNKERIEVKDPSKLNSGILMSPDDDEATYRFKGSEKSKGFVTHLSETANPDNRVDLITDICVYPNNVGDAEILEHRLPTMVERTPQIQEYFVDGQYGSPGVDVVTEKHEIQLYQTVSRGKESKGGIAIRETEPSGVWVSCKGGQDIKAFQSEQNEKRWKAEFDQNLCEKCPFKNECAVKWLGGKKTKRRKVYYFKQESIKIHKRLANISHLQGAKRFTRANVEATVKEAKRGMRNKKVRVRQRIRVSLHMIFTAIGVNLSRIHKKMVEFYQKYTDRHLDSRENKIPILQELNVLILNLKIHVYKIEEISCF